MHLHGLQEILADRCTKTMAAFFLSNSDQFSPAGAAALAPLHLWVLILHRIVALHQILHFVFQDQLFSPKASKIPLPQVLKCRTWGLSSYWDFQDPQSENSSRNPISWWALPWCLPWHLLMVPRNGMEEAGGWGDAWKSPPGFILCLAESADLQ